MLYVNYTIDMKTEKEIYSTETYFEDRRQFFKLIADASSYATGQIALAKKAKDKHRERFWVDMQRMVAHSCRDMGNHIREVQDGRYAGNY